MTNRDEYEEHPSFGVVTIGRLSGTGRPLFQSDLLHNETMRLTIHRAERKRDLNHDWVHPGKELIEIEMSLAQWGSLISSQGIGSGTPVTLKFIQGQGQIEETPFAPRMQESLAEVDGTVKKLLDQIAEKTRELNEAIDGKKGVKVIRAAQNALNAAVQNAAPNAKFAVDSLTRAAEKVVGHARADIESSILEAHRLTGGQASIVAPQVPGPKAIEADVDET